MVVHLIESLSVEMTRNDCVSEDEDKALKERRSA